MPSTVDRKCHTCPTLVARENRTGLCWTCYKAKRAKAAEAREAAEPKNLVTADRERAKHAQELHSVKIKYEESLKTIARHEKELQALDILKRGLDTFSIEPSKSEGKSEATAVWVASDWHVEENVGVEVGGLNVYNLEIAKYRASRFFQKGLRLTDLLAHDITIPTIVLALLGDYISNDIHDEFPEINEESPMHALVSAQNFIISGIEFLLENSKYKIVCPCHSGNHARTTKTTRFSAENGHSLEYLLYLHLRAYFRNEPRVTFLVAEGMHSYMQFYEGSEGATTVRFQHGHAIKYQGGVGGIYIPVNKAIAQWNKARHADLDVFGHFHQARDGGNFICNGSLIGYNAFALSIKADYEQPKQQMFLMDKKRGRTCTWPILVK